MDQISRRTFLVRTGTVAALYPMIGALQSCTPDDIDRELLDNGLQINEENGFNFTMYFFNLKFRGSNLVPDKIGKSYIVVQIPPQSLHEKYFIQQALNATPKEQQEAKLSGHSFLAFELWPIWPKNKKKIIDYRKAELMDWQNPTYFKLLSTYDHQNNFQKFDKPCDVNNAILAPITEKALISIDYYTNILSKLLGKDELRHLTIFELPAGLLLAPHKRSGDTTISVIRNDYNISDQTFWIHSKNEHSIKRRILERGTLELQAVEKPDGGNPDEKRPPISVPPSLRGIAIFSTDRFQTQTSLDPCACITSGIPSDNYLPSLLDEGELLFLNQLSNTDKRFDIKAKSPFLLGSSGATVKFFYNNHDLNGINPSISLVEYEHHFQEGRDNFIKVARIGVIAPTSQKALHVKIAERKEIDGISFVDYKEFIEILEPEKKFPHPSADARIRITYTGPGPAGAERKHYENQIHFSRIKSNFKRTPPIMPVQECLNHFWVYTEFAKPNPPAKDPENHDLMFLEFDQYDQNGTKLEKPARHAIFFMRRDFFCSGDRNDLLQKKMELFDDGVKLRMQLHNQMIALTPDDPDASSKTANKINQMVTASVDYYFTIADPKPDIDNIFDTEDYVIYSQMSRAIVFIEHYQHYGQNSLPSVVIFNNDYLAHYMNTNENPAKVLLEESDDFINGKILNFLGNTNTSLGNITALDDGYKRIIEVFNEAGDKVGGMVNPGIRNKLFAFGEQGLTYPKDINSQWKTIRTSATSNNQLDKVLKSIDIFSTDAEILGVSIVSILGEISEAGGTPGFAADKLLAQIDNFKEIINGLQESAIVLEAVQEVEVINNEIVRLKNIYDAGKAAVEVASRQLNAAKDDLLALVPDINKIRTAAKLAFERKRLKVFEQGTAVLSETLQAARDEVVREIYNLRPDFTEFEKYITNNSVYLKDDLKDLINKLPEGQAELKARLAFVDSTLFTEIKNAVALFTMVDTNGKLIPNLEQISNGRLNVLIGMDFNDYFSKVVGSEGILFLRENYQILLNKYFNGDNVLTELNACKARLSILEDKLKKSLYEKVKTILICYDELVRDIATEAEKAAADRFFDVLRLLNKSSISYYVERYLEFKRDFDDLVATTSALKEIFDAVQTIAESAADDRQAELKKYIEVIIQSNPTLNQLHAAWKSVEAIENKLLIDIEKKILDEITQIDLSGVSEKVEKIKALREKYESAVGKVTEQLTAYEAKLVGQAKNVLEQVEKKMKEKLDGIVDARKIKETITEFERIKKILTTPKTEEFKYQWETGNFKTANLGILKFNPQSNPPTKLKVDVKTTVHIDPLKFPNVVQRIDTYAENSLTNFSLTFLSALTVDFAHLRFVTGSSVKTNMNVGIRDVKFDGALSFVQKLEELLGGLGDGFSISIKPVSVGIGYNSPVFNISTPGFTFSNISFGVLLQIFFDRRPMELTFMLAKPEAKATIAAGIYGGGFYCALTAQPKNGLKSIEMAIEMGALLGIRLGPIKGEVRFMIGLFYRKDDTAVILEGYFVAEGILSVWIISVSARLYMYVRSQNSSVTGGCKATYSAKLGFVKKSFTGSYSKRLAGAESKRSNEERNNLLEVTRQFRETTSDLFDYSFISDDYQPMKAAEWKKFHHTFYRH